MKNNAGFTILETLIGFTIITFLLLVLTEAIKNTAELTKRMDNAAIAASFGRSLLAEFGMSKPIIPGIIKGTIETKGYWTARITDRQLHEHPGLAHNTPIRAYDIKLNIQLGDSIFEIQTVRSKPKRSEK